MTHRPIIQLLQRASRTLPLATRNPQRVTRNRQPATRNSQRIIGSLLFFCLLVSPLRVGAENAGSLVDSGNAFYAAGEFDKALEAYEKALAEQPEAGETLFNKGNALFQKGEFEQAREAYQAAALHARDSGLEASAQYNLGHVVFAEGQRELESDPKKALSRWGQSVQHFQEALRIDPQREEAAQNIEVVRLAIKDLADRLKQAEEAAREQQQQREELKKKLEEVIREQEAEIRENDILQQKAVQKPGESLSGEVQTLAADQEATRRKTESIAEELKGLQGSPPSSPQPSEPAPSASAEHLEKALTAQRAAVEKLKGTDLEAARSDQEEALQHLKGASNDADAGKNQGQCPNPQAGGQGPEEEAEEKDREQPSPQGGGGEEPGKGSKPDQQQATGVDPEGGQEKRGEPEKEGKTAAAFSESPENILREEKEDRLQLQRAQQGAYKPVDKDW